MKIKCEAGEFEINEDMKKIIDKFGTPFAAGIFLKQKNPSIQEIMMKKLDIPKIIVNKMGEKNFIYGKDILNESIIKKETDSGKVIVCNEKGDKLGIGEFEEDIVKNLADIGIYLRKEKS